MDNQRKFKNLSGEEITCTYIPLTMMEALEVQYKSLGTIAAALEAAGSPLAALFMESKGEGADKDMEALKLISGAIAAIYKAIPWEVLKDVASKVLRGCIIEGPQKSAKITSLEESDYFTDRMDDFMLCLFWGLDVSYPRVFTAAQVHLNAFKGQNLGQTSQQD